MAINTENGEKHVLVKVDDATLTDDLIQSIQSSVLKLWEKSNDNIVLFFTQFQADSPEGMGFLKDLSDQATEKGCSLVIAGDNEALRTFADENEISHAPTREEAVDLVFIEGIEREFNEGDAPDFS